MSGREKNLTSVLKVPRHCPFVLLVRVTHLTQFILLGYRNPVRTSQKTHYVSATEPNRLMLCKICGVLACDYEECRLLSYKKPNHTSQEIHYVSATEPSPLILCKI
jgi:hypothetical protein